MWQIINLVCLCQWPWECGQTDRQTDGQTHAVSHSMCLSVRTLTVSRSHFFIDFAKIGTEVTTPKSKKCSLGEVNIAPPLPRFCPKTAILGQKVLKINANIKYANFWLKCLRIAGIPVPFRKSGSKNTMVTQIWGRYTAFLRTYF